jgi:NADH:ubiquinone oxidoreductase subunit F (NADH-binding)
MAMFPAAVKWGVAAPRGARPSTREGTARLLELLDGVARAGVADSLVQLRELADVVQLAALCGLGQAAPLSLRAALEHSPESLTGAR